MNTMTPSPTSTMTKMTPVAPLVDPVSPDGAVRDSTDVNAELSVVLAAARRALSHPHLFADPDDIGELERAIDAVEELLARRREFVALMGGDPRLNL